MGSAAVLIDSHHAQLSHSGEVQRDDFSRQENGKETVAVPPHPLRIKPAGNAYTSDHDLKSAAGHFACLPDELIVQVLEYLDARDLLQLEATCRALYAFSHFEDLWKTFFIEYVLSPI